MKTGAKRNTRMRSWRSRPLRRRSASSRSGWWVPPHQLQKDKNWPKSGLKSQFLRGQAQGRPHFFCIFFKSTLKVGYEVGTKVGIFLMLFQLFGKGFGVIPNGGSALRHCMGICIHSHGKSGVSHHVLYKLVGYSRAVTH